MSQPSDATSRSEPRLVVVTGSRSWECFDLAVRVLSDLVTRTPEGFVIHHGDAKGVDASFKHAARFVGVEQVPHRADWNRWGRGAGPRRNEEMIGLGPDVVLAFHPEIEKHGGTHGCVCLALDVGVPVYHCRGEDCPPLLVRSLRRGRIEYETSRGPGY
jgi:hypothetical protein